MYLSPLICVAPKHHSSPQVSPTFPHVDVLEFMLERLTQIRLALSPLVFWGFHQNAQSYPWVSAPGISRRQWCCQHGPFLASVTLNERKNKTQNLNSALRRVSGSLFQDETPSRFKQGDQRWRSTTEFPWLLPHDGFLPFLLHCCVVQPYSHSSP